MNRAELQARLAASSVKAEIMWIPLASGDKVGLRRATNDEMIRAMAAAGNDLDQQARLFTAALRFCVVDDDGEPLLQTFEEAAAFVNTLAVDDFLALRDAVESVQPALGDDAVVEAGKAS